MSRVYTVTPAGERVLRRTVIADCWEWQGALDERGYGRIRRGSAKEGNTRVHRAVWEYLVGPIDKELTLDHLCRNTVCVNPDHLEPVSMGVNVLRGYSPSAIHARKTHCHKGHPFDAVNTYVYPSGRRRCMTCFYDSPSRKAK